MIQSPISELLDIVSKITDNLDQSKMDQVVALLDQLSLPVSRQDALALLSLLPEGGDTGNGVNWTVLHAIEASPHWPIWEALNQPHNEWMEILEIRLNNARIVRATN